MTHEGVSYRDGVLSCEGLPLPEIAEKFGTPCYVYSQSAIERRIRDYREALEGTPHLLCFAVKANSNLGVLRAASQAGAGFDIVSGGELYRVLAAGGDPKMVVFSGVGKTADEIRFALDQDIHSFNCESEAEIQLISHICVATNQTASIAIRVNPEVDAATHPYISTGLREHKFGVPMEEAEALYRRAAQLPGLRVEGVSCHIGSQLLDISPLLEAADKAIALVRRLRDDGIEIRSLDLGGGIGVRYRTSDSVVSISGFVAQLRERVRGLDVTLMLEPGRSIVAEAGILLTRVLLTKRNGRKTFVIVDAAMNDLLRPSLYQAHHEIVPVLKAEEPTMEADVVGPVCETGDFFARNRVMPAVQSGDLLAVRTCGAYGFVLASNYNSRPRGCELLVKGEHVQLVRKRETYEDLIRGETAL